jgi:hypothetical protein
VNSFYQREAYLTALLRLWSTRPGMGFFELVDRAVAWKDDQPQRLADLTDADIKRRIEDFIWETTNDSTRKTYP